MTEPPVDTKGEEVTPAPRRTGVPHFDLAVTIAAILMSAASLYLAIENGRTQRATLASSQWPFLQTLLSNGHNGTRDVAIGVTNAGVGPAKVRSLEVSYAGVPVRSAEDLLRRCCGLAPGPVRSQLAGALSTSTIDDSVLRAGEENIVLLFKRGAVPAPVIDRLADSSRMLRIGFRACYCSVLDECWTGDLRTTQPTPVKFCPAPAHPFEPNGD